MEYGEYRHDDVAGRVDTGQMKATFLSGLVLTAWVIKETQLAKQTLSEWFLTLTEPLLGIETQFKPFFFCYKEEPGSKFRRL